MRQGTAKILTIFVALLPLLDLTASPEFTINGDVLTAVKLNGETEITIPSGVTGIGNNVFRELTSLRRVTIPIGITSIGHNAFYGCTSLSDVNIPEGVTTIGDWAFKNCMSLMGISIPGSVTRIGGDAFTGCGFTYTGGYGYGYFAGDYGNAHGSGYSNVRFTISNGELTNVELYDTTGVTIPNVVTRICNNAFRHCRYELTSVIISDSVTSIGADAFADCDKLTSVVMGCGVTSLESRAFKGCESLTTVMILGSLPDCGNDVFTDVADGCVAYVDSSVDCPEDGDSWNGLTVRKAPLPHDTDMLSRAIFTIDHGELTDVVLNGSTEVMIPGSVMRIRPGAFDDCRELTCVLIPDPGTIIDSGSFNYCYNLTNVVTFANIGYGAFDGCDKLTSVTIGASVTSIGVNAFRYCSGLTSVTIPPSVTMIGAGAFLGCSGLRAIVVDEQNPTYKSQDGLLLSKDGKTLFTGVNGDVTIPYGVTSIGSSAFYNCRSLTSVTIPNSVTNIGNQAFYYCSGLTSVTIPDSVVNIGASAFSDCSGLTSVTIPGSVTNIGERAFFGCSGLISITVDNGNVNYSSANGLLLSKNGDVLIQGVNGVVTIPDSVNSIGDAAFRNCTGLTRVTMPGSVTNIGEYAFAQCSGLSSVTIGNGVTNIGSYAFYYCSSLTSVTIPDSVKSIGDSAFLNCTGLTCMTIPDSVTGIGAYAFAECSSLSNVMIGNGVTNIGSYAFYYCKGLTSVTIPDNVTGLGAFTFCGCNNLSLALLPARLSGIVPQTNHFKNCASNLRVVFYDEIIVTEGIELAVTDGVLVMVKPNGATEVTIPVSVTSIGENAFSSCRGVTSITISASVTSIGASAFSGCNGLRSVTISDGVTNIGASAFYGCSSLTSVTIPSSVTSIGASAFSGCNGLRSVTISDGVTSIGASAFYGCSSLTSVTIPSSVTSIGASAFSGCSDSIYDTTTLAGVKLVDGWAIGVTDQLSWHLDLTGIRGIATSAFSMCFGLESVTIPASVTSIGEGAFPRFVQSIFVDENNPAYKSINGLLLSSDGSTLLFCDRCETDVTIPDSVTNIWEYAFYGCNGLASVTIPDSVTSIGNGTFFYCTNLTSVTIGNGVTRIGVLAFGDCSGLTSMTIGHSVTNIDYSAFDGCSGLSSVTFTGDAPNVWNPWVGSIFESRFKFLTEECKVYVKRTASGWPAEGSKWNELTITYYGAASEKAAVEVETGGYALTANAGEALTENDVTFTAVIGGTLVDATKGYEVKVAADGKSAAARLRAPIFGAVTVAEDETPPASDGSDPSGALVVVDENELAAKPMAKNGEEVGALPVATVPGLYYQAAWGDDLGNLTTGARVQATTDTLYLGVIKQAGAQGFYRVIVSE